MSRKLANGLAGGAEAAHEAAPRAATIGDVAQEAGLSTATVSRVLNGKGNVAPRTRAAVLRAVRRVDYRPDPNAQRLARGRCTHTIGLFSLALDLGVGMHTAQRIQSRLIEGGFSVPLYGYASVWEAGAKQVELVEELCRQRPRAIVFHGNGLLPASIELLRRYRNEGGLLVAYAYVQEVALECDQVILDTGGNTYRAAKYLLGLGHRRIGYAFHGRCPRPGFAPGEAGFARALSEEGAEDRPEWHWYGVGQREHECEGEALAEQFLSWSQRPSAMVLINDTMAYAFLSRVQAAGVRVPEDLSVVGHDDRPVARLCSPALTTVSHPVQEIASQVVGFLHDRLGGLEAEPRRAVLQGELRIRHSSGPPQEHTGAGAGSHST